MGLKIAMVTPYKVKCGIFTYSENLIEALVKFGVEVYVLRLPRFGRKTKEMLQNVAGKARNLEVDCLHVQHEYGLYKGLEDSFYAVLKSIGKPVISTMHSTGNWTLDGIVSKYSSRVIVHNKFCQRRFTGSSIIIPHGCKPVTCPPKEECRKNWNIHPLDVPVVGYAGFISEYKGLEFLIEAMSKVKAALLIGGGWHVEAETTYIRMMREKSLKLLPKKCEWLGYIPDDQLSSFYGSLDVVVYPSRFSTESGALLMALSHGKPVIASNLPPFKEKEKLGALMTFKTVKDLTRKIKRLLKDEELRRKLEEGAKRYAKETSWQVVAQKHVELYKEVCG